MTTTIDISIDHDVDVERDGRLCVPDALMKNVLGTDYGLDHA